jgi:hypothetical protein
LETPEKVCVGGRDSLALSESTKTVVATLSVMTDWISGEGVIGDLQGIHFTLIFDESTGK